MNETDSTVILVPNQSSKHVYQKFIEGEFGLAKTYWMFGVLVNLCVNIVLRQIESDIIFFALGSIFVAYLCALLVAVWHAGKKYQGPKFWVFLACLVVFMGIIKTAGALLVTTH